jgi:hypothetical protein
MSTSEHLIVKKNMVILKKIRCPLTKTSCSLFGKFFPQTHILNLFYNFKYRKRMLCGYYKPNILHISQKVKDGWYYCQTAQLWSEHKEETQSPW